MAIQLVTLGGLHLTADNGELDRLSAQHSRAALLVYLAVERCASRELLTTIFWPESDAENARHALRQSLYQIRRLVGEEWVESRAHELVVRDSVTSDAIAFTAAIERGDLATAVDLYRGAFLNGVHLVDLEPWEGWVDGKRAQYARAFRKACRDLLDARRAAGDRAGDIAVAERWVARDPSDDEAQHRLIEALADAGERAEAIRQYESYARLLEPDGLEPLDETRELARRLRSDAMALPPLRPVSVAGPKRLHQPATAPNESRSPPGRRYRRPLLVALATAAALVGIAGSWWGWHRNQVNAAPVGPAAIAVFPFSIEGSSDVRYLGDGLVNLLVSALDGAGALRPVDSRATFAAVAGNAPGDPAHAERLANRLGASLYMLGNVVEAGGRVQIEAAVYPATSACERMLNRAMACRPGEASAHAVVTGSADSVFDLVDRLAAGLLGSLGDPAADRLLRLASTTTTSLPALKQYLAGEALMRDGQFERAADAYVAATAIDSTFAIADYRLALAREWAPLAGEQDAADAAVRHGARLSPRDRALLSAFSQWRLGDAVGAERTYRTILTRYPDDVDAWFQLGEIQFHHGPLLGRPVVESEAAWRRVLQYEPRNLFALTHLARIAVVDDRAATLDSLLAPFTFDQLRSDRRLAEIVLLRDLTRHDTAAALSIARDMRHWESLSAWRVGVFLTAFARDAGMMRLVVDELSRDSTSSALHADLRWMVSVLELAGGRVAAADTALAGAIAEERALASNERRAGFQAVTTWYALTLPLPYPDSVLERARRGVLAYRAPRAADTAGFEDEIGLGKPIRLEPLRQYTLGILSSRLHDTTAAESAARALHRMATAGDATTLVRDLDRGLRARLAVVHGNPGQALELLRSLECSDSQGDIALTPFVTRANERFFLADLLLSLGRDAEARRWFASIGDGSVTEVPLRALSQLRQAGIAERAGRRDEAAEHYTRFLALWQHADPEFQPLVEEARRRLALLTTVERRG